MRLIGVAIAAVIIVAAFLVAFALVQGCTPGQRTAARTALNASQVACVLLSTLSDEASIAHACSVADDLRPALRELVQGKASAARAGACRTGMAPDAGAPDGGLW